MEIQSFTGNLLILRSCTSQNLSNMVIFQVTMLNHQRVMELVNLYVWNIHVQLTHGGNHPPASLPASGPASNGRPTRPWTDPPRHAIGSQRVHPPKRHPRHGSSLRQSIHRQTTRELWNMNHVNHMRYLIHISIHIMWYLLISCIVCIHIR